MVHFNLVLVLAALVSISLSSAFGQEGGPFASHRMRRNEWAAELRKDPVLSSVWVSAMLDAHMEKLPLVDKDDLAILSVGASTATTSRTASAFVMDCTLDWAPEGDYEVYGFKSTKSLDKKCQPKLVYQPIDAVRRHIGWHKERAIFFDGKPVALARCWNPCILVEERPDPKPEAGHLSSFPKFEAEKKVRCEKKTSEPKKVSQVVIIEEDED